jgi:ABC-type antimicrobial peptide transport system permease subunit
MVGRALEGVYEGLSLGESVALQKSRRVEIVGVFEAEGSSYESELWTDEEVVKTSFGYEGYVSSITAQLVDEGALSEFEAAVKQTVPTGLNIERERSYYERVSSGLADSISGLGLVIGFVFCLGAGLGAAIAMFGAVAERVTEVGVLRALGFSARHVLVAFLLESLGLSLVGGIVGIALALLTPFLRFSTVNWATGQEVAFGFVPSLGILLTSLGAGVLVGMLGGVFPAARAARIDTLAAMRK